MRAVLRVLLYFMAFALGGVCLALYIKPDLWSGIEIFVHDFPQQTRLIAAAMAIVLTLSPLSIALRWLQARRRSREISYTNDGGRVAVNLIAIQEALTRALEHEDCVRKAHVHVYDDRMKRQVVIDAEMTFWEVPNVTERNRQCQQLLRRRFAELMPEQKVVVNLNVHKITPRREREESRVNSRTATVIEPEAAAVAGPSPFAGTPLEGAQAGAKDQSPVVGMYLQPPVGAATGSPPSLPEPAEDDLYVGPAYPVEDTNDDGESSGEDYLGRPIPVRKPSGRRG